MVVVIVDEKEFNLTEKDEAVMKYIQEAIALEKGGKITITTIDEKTFQFILDILKKLNYTIEEPTPVKNNILEEHINKELAGIIGKLDAKELNNLYRAAHYLKIYPLRRSIAAVTACRVYIKPTLQQYNSKKAEIGLKQELTAQKSKEYKERFPFMN